MHSKSGIWNNSGRVVTSTMKTTEQQQQQQRLNDFGPSCSAHKFDRISTTLAVAIVLSSTHTHNFYWTVNFLDIYIAFSSIPPSMSRSQSSVWSVSRMERIKNGYRAFEASCNIKRKINEDEKKSEHGNNRKILISFSSSFFVADRSLRF